MKTKFKKRIDILEKALLEKKKAVKKINTIILPQV
jgi:hypothetical protein